MSKKLQGNGLFESSRMMLPEHKEAYLHYREQLYVKEKPHLDEQKLDQFSQRIREALEHQLPIRLTIYHPLQAEEITGMIEKVDPYLMRIKLRTTTEQHWIDLNQIVNLELLTLND